MNFKALITTALVLGTSSMALANPWQSTNDVRDHRTTVAMRGEVDARFDSRAPASVRDHRDQAAITYQTPTPAPAYGLYTVASFSRAFDGVKSVDLGCDGRALTKLRIASNDLNSEVYNVTLHFTNGQSYTYSENHIFGAATDGQLGHNLDFNFVAGTTVKSIDVSARNASNSAFRVEVA